MKRISEVVARPERRNALAAALALVALSAHTLAQCPSWQPGFEGRGILGDVDAVESFDAGGGAALFVGGSFEIAGPVFARNIARWDGTQWTGLGDIDGRVSALYVHDDGSGPALYAGGAFTLAGGVAATNIARWNGSSWSPVGGGTNGAVTSFVEWDDGSGAGPALYVAGSFTIAGGVSARCLARWDGASWSSLSTPSGTNAVWSLCVWDDPAPGGPVLFAGGGFSPLTIGVARFDGTSWTSTGMNACCVWALATHDDGGGSRLYAGGDFLSAGGVTARGIARWNGSTWSSVGGAAGDSGSVYALRSYDDGSAFGPALYAFGNIAFLGGASVSNAGRWNGTSWSRVGTGLPAFPDASCVFDDGSGPRLIAGGERNSNGAPVIQGVASWNAASWNALDAGPGSNGIGGAEPSFQPIVNALATFDDGSGNALIAAGLFRFAGEHSARNVARWDGAEWSALGAGLPGVLNQQPYALQSFDAGLGAGPQIIVGGSFPGGVLRWNGSVWSTLGGGTNNQVVSFAVHDDGGGTQLYAGGTFSTAGGVAASRIARWNGASWSSVGSGMDGIVAAMCTFDDGSGPALYAGGDFPHAGGVLVNSIARWDGSAWSDVGGGMGGPAFPEVLALVSHDDGSGPALYAAGNFFSAGGVSAMRVARWDGATWSALGSGFDGYVLGLASYDEGTGRGRALYAVGDFTTADGASATRVARWDGSSWSAVDGGASGTSAPSAMTVRTVASFSRAGQRPVLAIAGHFDFAGAHPAQNIAVLASATPETCAVGTAFCAGDGLDPVVTTGCPCANTGAPGHGCANQVVAGGALLSARGSTHLDPSSASDSVVLTSSGMPATTTAIFLQGDASLDAGVVFGDGVRCVDGQLVRLSIKAAVGGVATFPEPGNASLSQRGGVALGSGAVRGYQTYYRSAAAAFCPPATFNVTNGVRLVW